MTKKKNQHFVPRFYLKNFSLKAQRKEINIYNISSRKYIRGGSLKGQASKNYFYGRDLEIENLFQELESKSAELINTIINKHSLPQIDTGEYQTLLEFIILLLGRTVYAAEEIQEIENKCKDTVLSVDKNFMSETERLPEITLTESVQESLKAIILYFPLVTDLRWKIIANETDQPFITSDNPVVLYNQFLESRKKYGNNVGLASKGLQIFLPLSPKLVLALFDQDVYRMGSRRGICINTNSDLDVTALNSLQIINSNNHVYFNENLTEEQLKNLVTLGFKYRRATKANWDQYPDYKNNKILLHSYKTDIRCSLRLSFTSLTKKAKSYDLGQRVTHVRDEKLCRLHEKFIELVDQGLYEPLDFHEFAKKYQKIFKV